MSPSLSFKFMESHISCWVLLVLLVFRVNHLRLHKLPGLVPERDQFFLSQQPLTACSNSSRGGALWDFPYPIGIPIGGVIMQFLSSLDEILWVQLPSHGQRTLAAGVLLLLSWQSFHTLFRAVPWDLGIDFILDASVGGWAPYGLLLPFSLSSIISNIISLYNWDLFLLCVWMVF